MSATLRNNPSLPQNDTMPQQQVRRSELATAATRYQWTTLVDSLPGIPLVSSVPVDDKPSSSWFLAVASIAVDIAENQLQVKLANHDGLSNYADKLRLDKIRQALEAIRREVEARAGNVVTKFISSVGSDGEHFADDFRIRLHEIINEQDNIISNLKDSINSILSMCRSQAREKLQAMQEFIEESGAAEHLRERVENLLNELKDLIEKNGVATIAGNGLSPYRKLFKTLTLTPIADDFLENQSFARMRVAGPNPVLIQGIAQLPAKLPMTDSMYQQVMGGSDDLTTALAEGRIYILDYEELLPLIPGSTGNIPKFVFSPIALFAVPKGGSSLTPVAIQCGQDPEQYPIFLRADASTDNNWWAWQLARRVVQVAEGNYHELFVHLAHTHLVVESFAIATRRELAPTHPLNILLLPHFEGTLYINDLAAGGLIAKDGPIDKIFGARIESTQRLVSEARLSFDFYAKMLPADLRRRKVADASKLPDYPYRDDALLVWNAISNWVKSYVQIYYKMDADVVADYELTGWVESLQKDGKIAGFTAITSCTQLVEVLTMVIFTASAQHAAANYPQRTLMSYAPVITGAGWAAAPAAQGGHSEAGWVKELVPIAQAQEQLNTLWLLGSVYYRKLGDYRSNRWPYQAWFNDPRVEGPLKQFRAALESVEAQIKQNNDLRPVAYDYLKPSLIPNSINI